MNKEEFTLLVTKVGLSVADIEGSIAELLKLEAAKELTHQQRLSKEEAEALEKLTAEQLQSAAIDAAEANEDRAAEAKLEGAAEKDEEPLTMAQVEPKLVAQGSEYRNADARLYPSRHTASQNVPFPFSFRPPPPLHYN